MAAIVTVITMYRASDAEMFVHVVDGQLTAEQREAWRKGHLCDDFCPEEEEDDGCVNNMCFREIKAEDFAKPDVPCGLLNWDGEEA